MRHNSERVAWIVLLLAFATFCLIIVAVPLGVRRYIRNAEKEQEALVESLAGTIVVEPPLGIAPIPLSAGQSMTVPEGSVIRADETSEAAITFFDHSFMRLFSDSVIRLDRSRSPRYKSSPLANTVHVTLMGGQVHIATALSLASPLDYRVTTLHSQASLKADGSYAIEATNDRSEIAVYRGHAQVTADKQTIAVDARQRSTIAFGQAPEPPVGVAQDLVTNGDFSQPLSKGWRTFNDQGADGGDVDGTTELVLDQGRRAVKLQRVGGQGNHCETILEQGISRKLPDPATSLIVRATVKVSHQSLSGGGYLSSEYPLMIRLTYRDVYDSEAEWIQGFYYENPINTPTAYGLQIPRDRWYLFESDNLLESLPIRPYRIIKLRVYAAGWDYERDQPDRRITPYPNPLICPI